MIIGFAHNGQNTEIAGKLTQWFTQQPYTHCELFVEPHGVAVSAQPKTGVKVEPAKEALKRNNHWEFWHVPTANPAAFHAWILAQVNKPYDYADIARMFSAVSFRLTDSWFCSELCYVAVRDYSMVHIRRVSPDLVHPGALLRLIKEAGAKQIDAYSSLITA